MNIRVDFPVVLLITSSEDSETFREELLARLIEYPVEAIYEMDSETGLRWSVSFGETAWSQDEDHDYFDLQVNEVSAPLNVRWRRHPDLESLVTAAAGKRLVNVFGARVKCALQSGGSHWSPTAFEESHRGVKVGRIVVAPPWIFPDMDRETIIVKIRPSAGFGTGHHPSTRLALALLQQIQCEGRDVLDVGTGSGILAIAAARLGASHVCAVDRDRDALAAAADSVQRNAVKKVVELKLADISVDTLGEFDVVIANLEAPQIAGCASSLLACVRSGGLLLLSGFLTAELGTVAGALSQQPALVEYEDGWAATVFLCPVR